MKPVWRRVESEIIVLANGREYRFNWRDADIATALYASLLAEAPRVLSREKEKR